ncbi:hypothetical protein F511_15140 [Dorcoceras hygrometricum]|uniref:Uncharacterized protein n=1 Tax=Dorcoceras hygrometricum TaxID=472368 RepID=A0A2Z7BB67_9LAMI|nr:hypothetical protein F511_15140 [Dorcoceras hygrometricum]
MSSYTESPVRSVANAVDSNPESPEGVELVEDLGITASCLSRVITYTRTRVMPELEIAWGGEVIKRLTRAHRAVNESRQSFDEAMRLHSKLVAQLEELESIRAQEKRAAEAQKEMLEAQLATEKAARAAEKEAMRSELDDALTEKTAIEVELYETKARAEEEVGIRRLCGSVLSQWLLRGGAPDPLPKREEDEEMPDEDGDEEDEKKKKKDNLNQDLNNHARSIAIARAERELLVVSVF